MIAKHREQKMAHETRRKIAVKLRKKHRLGDSPIRVHYAYNSEKAGVVYVEAKFDDLAEAQANKIIVALKKMIKAAGPTKSKANRGN